MLIQVLLTIVEDGNFADNASKQEWMRIITIFKEMSKKSFTRQQMSSDVSEMKKNFRLTKVSRIFQDFAGTNKNILRICKIIFLLKPPDAYYDYYLSKETRLVEKMIFLKASVKCFFLPGDTISYFLGADE